MLTETTPASRHRFDTSEWTQVSDRREDRKEYSDWTDEDTGFSEVIALESKNHSTQTSTNVRQTTQRQTKKLNETKTRCLLTMLHPQFDWRRPRTWLEWTDKKGKLRLMCGIYFLEDGQDLEHYHIVEGEERALS